MQQNIPHCLSVGDGCVNMSVLCVNVFFYG